jgi:hypothetical protein
VLAKNLEFCQGLWDAYKDEADQAGRSIAEQDIVAWGGIISIDHSREGALAKLEAHWWVWDQCSCRSIRRGRWQSWERRTRSAGKLRQLSISHGSMKCISRSGKGIPLEKNEVVGELELFASKVMPRFS